MKTDTGYQIGLSIFHKLLLSFIGTSLLIILIMGSAYYYYAEERVNNYVNSEISTGLKNAVFSFESSYTNPIKSDLTLLESSPSFDNFFTVPKEEIHFVRFDIEKMFHRLSSSKAGVYKDIVFFDAYGHEKIAIKNKRRVRKFSSISQYEQGSPYDQGKALLFTKLTKSSPGTVLFEGPFKDSDNKQLFLAGISKREPEIAGFGGVIMLSCDLTNFMTYLSNVKVFDRKVAWLLTGNGNILLSPPNRKELVDPRPYLEKESHLGGGLTEAHHHEFFIHCSGCVLDSSGQRSLVIAFSIPSDIFPELMNEVLLRAFMVSILVICIAILISYILAKQFVRPIIELSRASKLIGKGDFQVDIDKGSGGEIGELARTFDSMAKDLQQSIQVRDQEIVNRKQAEKEILKAKAEWERSFDAISDIVTIQEPDMTIIRVNKSACNFFELKAEEIVGRKCYELFRNSTEPCLGCPELKTIYDSTSHSQIVVHENLGKTFHVSAAPIIDTENNLEYLVHVAKDITDQKNLEDELFQAHKMEAIGTLAGGIAHDFNNILAAILGYAEMAKDDIPERSLSRNYIDHVLEASNRAKELVRQILTFSRKGPETQEPLQPSSIIKEGLKLMRASLPTTIAIQETIDSDCGLIVANPTNIHQILVNLCTNALHAMEDEKGVLTVKLTRVELSRSDIISESGFSEGAFVMLMVGDTGHGMDTTTVKRIFEPYFTTKGVGKGSGMGLALVHGIVEGCGGFIRVESELGKGTTFRIYFPVVEAKVVEVEDEKQEQLPGGDERILVVDDEEAIVGMYQGTLEKIGYKVTAYCSSEKALDMFQVSPNNFDIIITDQTMPNLTGSELAKKILEIKPDIPIIMCTGYSSMVSEEEAKQIGIKRFVMKPVSRKDLAIAVRDVLDKNKS